MMQLIPPDIRTWWNDWELRLIVLFSAFLQVILVNLGSRRKSIHSLLLRSVVWATYLIAGWTAVLALGVLSNRLANIKEKTGILGPNEQLTAFWAPFLLLHIGGPDSITSYSLEDNELWLRSFAVLVAKTVVTGYVYFLALTGSPLAVLAATMTVVGFIKLGERTLSLYFSSKDRLRDSMLSPPESGPIYPKITEQYSLKKDEGYHVGIDEVVEIAPQGDIVAHYPKHGEDRATTLRQAYGLFQIFKLLFVELILNVNDLGNCKSMFMHMTSEQAFDIVAVELGFMYDLVYTKAILFYTISGISANAILHSMWGIACRVITLSLTCAVLVFFCFQEWENYSRVDIRITFSLLGAAILLECYSILQMISSDWTSTWLLKNQHTYRGRIIRFLQSLPYGSKSWSKSVSQFSLIKFSLRRSPWLVRAIPWPRKAEKQLQKLCRAMETKLQSSVTNRDFRDNMKEWICKCLRDKKNNPDQKGSVIDYGAGLVLRKNSQHDMTWSTDEIEFDQSILIWHIATELCYYSDRRDMAGEQGNPMTNYKMSKMVSRYLLYLLVMHPSMMPAGIGLLRYADTSLEARKYFEEQRSSKQTGSKGKRQCLCKMNRESAAPNHESKAPKHRSAESWHVCEASGWLMDVNTDIQPSVMRGGNSKSVLFDACRLAGQLKAMRTADKRWELISQVWAEALFYSAYCCEGDEHAKQLSEGGELLSHVWLLMAHFGFSRQLNTSQGHAVARILSK